MKRALKFFRNLVIIFIAAILLFVVWFRIDAEIKPPHIDNKEILNAELIQLGDSIRYCDGSWLKLNEFGIWELYVEGSPFEIGVKTGKLAQDLIVFQEEVFVARLKEMIPSESYLNFLKYFVAFFNRDMDEYIPIENQQEIYGISLFASEDFNFIAPNYHRILNYHGAHDIGHAMQNLNLVACTAFASWNENAKDGELIVGRNFDFYMGADFARDKIIAFYAPEKGHQFASVTWGGMTGVLSGMNMKGLSVSLNAAKSEIPFKAKLPVSLLARKILQYASNIEEAYEIAKNTETFVSESFLIASQEDNKVVVIEKSPSKIDIFESQTDELVLTNHFQSNAFKNTELTKENIKQSASLYRMNRVKELLKESPKHDRYSYVKILRDQKGMGNEDIGMGNENAINQLIAHHSYIFKPASKQIWISANPYQLGAYVSYDLNKVFADSLNYKKPIYDAANTIEADSFLVSDEYKNFVDFREFSTKKPGVKRSKEEIEAFIKLNPNFFYTYKLAAQEYINLKMYNEAENCLKHALSLNIPRTVDKNRIEELLLELEEIAVVE